MPGEPDVSHLTGALRLQHGCHRAVFGEDAIRVFHPNDLMMLHQVDAVRLQALQAFVNLFGCELLRAPVNLRHQEHLVAVTIAQRFAHPDFAAAVVIIPAVVHEVDAAIDGAANDADAFPLVFGHAANFQSVADVVGDAHVGKQRIGLEHHADIALLDRHRRHVLAVE